MLCKRRKIDNNTKIIIPCLKSVSKSVTAWNTVGPGFCVQITEKNSTIGLWENLDAFQGFISPAFEGMVMSIHEASEVTIIEKIKLSHVRTSVDISTWILQNIYVSKCLASKNLIFNRLISWNYQNDMMMTSLSIME